MSHAKKNILYKSVNEPVNPSKRYDDVVTIHRGSALTQHSREGNRFEFLSDSLVSLQIHFVRANMVQVRYSVDGQYETQFPYAIDPAFEPDTNVQVDVQQIGDVIMLSTAQIKLLLDTDNLQFEVQNLDGATLFAQERGFTRIDSTLEGVKRVSMSLRAPKQEHYYGMGDKSCQQMIRGKFFENWCTDAFAYGADSDPLYRAIPLYYAVRQTGTYALFFNNTFKSYFSFDHRREGLLRFGAFGGEMNFYLSFNPSPLEACQALTKLLGPMPLPAQWTLGYHQCRWSYYPEARVMQIADTFRQLDIPCDAIWLDIDYMEAYKCFTWHPDRFPQPKAMLDNLKAQGFKTVVMIDPGIKVEKGYSVYESGVAGNHFCRRTSGELMLGPVWPGPCAFPDFTSAKTRAWWAEQYKSMVEVGVDGVWNDMNEPALFEVNHKTFPDQVMHHNEGQMADHRRIHNVYGMMMSRATFEGLQQHQPDKRPFVLSRATFAGGQRYAALWTGDNIANWEHLKIAVNQCLRLSVSGFSMVGTDIGGFVDYPDGELYTRWIQLGAFHPLFRTHSMGDHEDGDSAVVEIAIEEKAAKQSSQQEPWSYGEPFTSHAREAIRLRYKLLAYWYSLFYKHQADASPVIYPPVFAAPNQLEAQTEQQAFHVGPDMYVIPVLEKAASRVEAWLPVGTWFDFYTGQTYTGGQKQSFEVDFKNIPLLVKAGAVLPVLPLRPSTATAVDEITLRVYYNTSNYSSTLYEDAGEGYAYQQGQYRVTRFNLSNDGTTTQLHTEREGQFVPNYQRIKLQFWGFPTIKSLQVDGQSLDLQAQGPCQEAILDGNTFGSLNVKV
jgi:alpha-glucosidase